MKGRFDLRLFPTFLVSAAMALAAAPLLYAQENSAKAGSVRSQLAFEVVSIRQNKAGGTQHTGATDDGYRMTNMSLLVPILTAYPPAAGGDAAYFTNDRIMGGPDWMRSERYDIDAKVADANLAEWKKPASQKTMLKAMLRSMLADRCKLEVHRDSKEVPVYALVVGKNGPRFKDAKPDQPHPGGTPLPGGAVLVPGNGGQALNFYGATMVSLAQVLSNFAGRPVQDRTGLTGRYDFSLDRGPAPSAAEQPGSTPTGESGPSIFTVVQDELGLRLEPAKGLVETLVIDRMERPSEN